MVATNAKRESLADDIIWGVDGPDGIATFIGTEPRKAYYLIRIGRIPVRRLGHRIITASRSELRRLFGGETVA
jgi:hypothetical protein